MQRYTKDKERSKSLASRYNESVSLGDDIFTQTVIAEPTSSLAEVQRQVTKVAEYLWQRGWAERNAGNISVCLKDLPLTDLPAHYQDLYIPLTAPQPDVAEMCFFITAANSRMRDMARQLMNNAVIIRVTDDGTGYNIISHDGLTELRPTSELASHLGIHSMIARRGSSHRVVMHTHATELIALTHIKRLCNEQRLNRVLWGMQPEIKLLVPAGAGFVPYILPGTDAVGAATVRALETHDVALWEKHGVFAIGNTPEETFDLIDIVAKAASVYLLCLSSGTEPEGLTDSQLNELGKIKL
jgi:rhamnulose-1-phosphate aldolase